MHSSQMFKLIVCILGIFVCYFYYGIIQEKITRSKYGPEKTPFTFALSLVCIQCIVNAMFVKILTAFTGKVNDNTPTCFYGTCAFTYLAAMLSSNKALLYVPYPTQVIGKSCKPIPVMILGVLVAKKRYPLRKYLFILLIILGVALFMYNDKSKSTLSTNYGFGWGEILLLFSLTMDGLTGGIQDKVRARYLCNSNSMMYQMNLWSILFSSIGLWLTGEMFTFPNFVKKYPEILFNLVSFSIASALGQYFIFMTVAEFGPLTCSIATTTRKFFTVLASVIFFQNPLTLRQWIGTVLVFLGLSLDSFYGKIPLKKEKACSETK